MMKDRMRRIGRRLSRQAQMEENGQLPSRPVTAVAPPQATTPRLPSLQRSSTGEQRPASASPELYTEHFGLFMRPFALAPDPDFLFWPPAHKRAYAMLEYGVMTHSPITLITGDVGAGKTTLLLHLLHSLGPDVRVGLISNPNGSRAELLRWVLMSLDQPAGLDDSYVDLFSRFQAFLIDEYAAGRRVVLIFDEAQNLSREALEELRMFTNINSGKDELLQLVLVGQPELRDIVTQPNMRQFAQRVASNFHLTAMDRATVHAYVAHRMKIAGRARRVFSEAALDLVFDKTGGVPRLVNQLCDLSLVYAFTKGRKLVGEETVQQVLDDGVFFAVNVPGIKGDM
jgi:type II secretory pathway predicted ATPase ExeA